MVSHSDYYKDLGLTRHATSAEIRTAYKRLALTWHPDRNKAKDAEDKFKKIKQAYDILIDDNRRREYDQQQQQKKQQQQQPPPPPPPQHPHNTWYETPTNVNYTPANANKRNEQFNLHTFDHFMSIPIDPFDIINDIQYFQDSDFTSKMMNSPSYRNLYAQLFNHMNNESHTLRHILTSPPIYLNNDRLFRPASKVRSKHHSKRASSRRSPTHQIPVIQSTMPNDWFLNELIDMYEQQNFVFVQSGFHMDPFFTDLIHCTNCHKRIPGDRTHLIHHEQQCRHNHNRYTTVPSASVRV